VFSWTPHETTLIQKGKLQLDHVRLSEERQRLAVLCHTLYACAPRAKGSPPISYNRIYQALRPQSAAEVAITGSPIERLEKYKEYLRERAAGEDEDLE